MLSGFSQRAIEALEDEEDVQAASEARQELGRISHEELLRNLDFTERF